MAVVGSRTQRGSWHRSTSPPEHLSVRRCSQYSPGTVSRFRGVGLRLRTPPLYPIMTCSGEVDPGHLFIVAVAYKDLWGHPVTSTCRVKVSNIQSHSKHHSKSFDMKETVPAKISSKHCVKHRNVRNIVRLLHGFAMFRMSVSYIVSFEKLELRIPAARVICPQLESGAYRRGMQL